MPARSLLLITLLLPAGWMALDTDSGTPGGSAPAPLGSGDGSSPGEAWPTVEVLLGADVVGLVDGREACLGEVADLVLDPESGATWGAVVATDEAIARRVDLPAAAWNAEQGRVELPIGPRAFESLPEFETEAISATRALASRTLESEVRLADGSRARLAALRVDLAAQRLR